MKKKYLIIMLGLVLSFSTLSGCGNNSASDTEVSTEAEESDTLYGEVSSVSDDSITIEVGTYSSDDGTLTLSGEEKAITVTDDTTISRQGMGGAPGNGEAPENGEAPKNGEAPENGEAPGNGEAPEKPSDDSSDSSDNVNGNGNGNQPPEMPSQEMSLSDLSEGDTVSITLDEDGNALTITVIDGQGGMPGGGMSQGGVDSYDAVTEFTEDTEVDGESYTSEGTDENAIHIFDGANVTLKNISVDRTSEDSQGGDNSSFYGVGAAVLNTDGTAYISDSTITTDAKGTAGAFSYGDGTAYVADTDITTQKDTSGGIHVAGGGTLYAWDLNVETNGQSSAAIRSDRGGGTMVVDGGSYTSNGVGSPAIYSTADITVNDADLTANGSEAVCIEGLNTIRLYDSDLTGNMSDDDQNDCTWNVILYQSMSGDSEVGNSTFEMQGGNLTAKNGGMFYTTNTESTITLSNVDITYASDNDFFLRCTGNNNQRGWGESGANGADCLFTASSQEMEGDIIWDSISQLDFYMMDNSTLTGAIIDDETYAGNGGDGYCALSIEKGSTWIVTGNSTLSTLSNAGTIVDEDGNTVTIQGEDGTVYVKGTSAYTITVETYNDSADMSGASTLSNWSDYEVAKPEEL